MTNLSHCNGTQTNNRCKRILNHLGKLDLASINIKVRFQDPDEINEM